MESEYSSIYSGEQVDAAVEYYLRHTLTEDNSSYEYTTTIFCRGSEDSFPAKPFKESTLPKEMPALPFNGEIDGKKWYDVPNTSTLDWYQCVLKIKYETNMVMSLGEVLSMKGATGNTGSSGNDGKDGENGLDGEDGKNGNYTEYRYRRASLYALTLGSELKLDRYPEGWYVDWSKADVEDYSVVQSNIGKVFDKYLVTFSSANNIDVDNTKYFTELDTTSTFTLVHKKFYELHGVLLTTNSTLEALIVEVFKAFKTLYDTCDKGEDDLLTCNTEYHRLVTKYINEDHFWVLFMIYATIDGNTDLLIGEWSSPQRILGLDGKPGPSGSNGIDGIAGVNIGIAFTLGTEEGIRGDAPDPTTSPYNVNYNSLFASGTNWYKATPSVTENYPYIWFTQCRYLVTTDKEGNETYTFEDTWSKPARYTGLNGITTTETVYVRNPIIYPMGLYTPGVSYTNDGVRTPYVYDDGCYYYLSGLGSWSGTLTSTPSNNPLWWTKLEGFEALYTKVGIIANGLIGSAVFNGDYMFSQDGLDETGDYSDHYELFLLNYKNGSTLSDPYDDLAAFKPNFCVNFKTGALWSTSVDSAIEGAKTSVLLTAEGYSIQVLSNINNTLLKAGIDITSGEVKVTGEFVGTSNGTFSGDVSAKSLKVLYDDGSPAIIFTTYKESLGTPIDGSTLEEGTPVLLINYGGSLYLLSMIKLVTGSSSGHYERVQATVEDLYVASSISESKGVQGTADYHKITAAPYLTFVDNSGNQTGATVAAKLYDSSGTELNWSDYIGLYYTGTLITQTKLDTSEGIWEFTLDDSAIATTPGTKYNGTPSTSRVAQVKYCVSSSGSGGMVYTGTGVSIYTLIKIIKGSLTTINSKVVVGNSVSWNANNLLLSEDSSSVTYLKPYSTTATYLNPSGTSKTSDYFAMATTSAEAWTSTQIASSALIVTAPPGGTPTTPPTDE